MSDVPSGRGSRLDAAATVAKKKYAISRATLAVRQHQVLKILNRFGWCTAEMVQQIAAQFGVKASTRRFYFLLSQLKDMDLAVADKLLDGTRRAVFACSEKGILYLKAYRDDLQCDTNAVKDPASKQHFLALNSIMLRLRKNFKLNYWLTDFEVRSDRMARSADYFAKDYDAVAELAVGKNVVRFGVEYESKQQESARYEELCGTFAAEKFLHFVIYVLRKESLLSPISLQFEKVRGFVCFIPLEAFLKDGAEAFCYYWLGDELTEVTVKDYINYMAHRAKPMYLPTSTLSLDVCD